VSFIDAQIGLVLDGLEASGLADRTAVAIVSDHGFHLGDRGLWSKLTLFEPATRVPLLLRVPGATPRGQRCEALVELVDLLPTLGELCGFERPDALEGTSFAPLLRTPEREWKSAVFSICSRAEHAWIGRSLRSDAHRYTEWRRGDEVTRELYELASDPYESVNRAADPALASTRLELEERLHAGWRAALPG
jgi:arylsulfatase A-like enzyme